MKIPFIDIHTHHPVNSEEIISVESVFLQDIDFKKEIMTPFSAAVHPWHAAKFDSGEVSRLLDKLIRQPNLIAIGETGLDSVCHEDYRRQQEIFELHLKFAEKLNKPLIIHAVKSWNDLTRYLKKVKTPCILHGYSEGLVLTRQLTAIGCYFSLGKSVLRSTPRIREAIEYIPVESLFLESDDSQESISAIYREVSAIVGCPLDSLKNQVYSNFRALFYG